MSLVLRQILVLAACGAGLVALVGQLNHALSAFAVAISLPGLLVAFAALRLPPAPGLLVALLVGLWIDAATPVAFGRHAAILALAVCVMHRMRGRLPRNETMIGVVAALFVNLGIFAALAVFGLGHLPDPGAGALRLLADLLLSQLVTLLVGPWFFALQQRSLELVGAPPAVATSRFA
jgi:rod shape-determining protein MreD